MNQALDAQAQLERELLASRERNQQLQGELEHCQKELKLKN
jgi:hypothetical protein